MENTYNKALLIEKKKKKKPYSSKTYTTGDPAYEVARFNSRNGTDYKGVPNAEMQRAVERSIVGTNAAAQQAAQAVGTFASASPDGGSSISSDGGGDCGGSVGESLVEAKRLTKRYYIRPQHIWCANKEDILKALAKIDDENCSIYTLKNLDDHDDVHLLTNKDIIYYYDDGILYDKNRVKVLDYDLFIKHEEDRKKFNPDKVSEETFNKEYDDRMTEDLNDPFDLDYDDYNVYGKKSKAGREMPEACCICGEKITGYGNNAEPYMHGRCCDACNIHYIIPARIRLSTNVEEH